MRITKLDKKVNKALIEAAERADDVAARLGDVYSTIDDIGNAPVKELVADMAGGAAEAGKAIDVPLAAQHAAEVKQTVNNFKLHPYASTAKLGLIEATLQTALEAAKDMQDVRGSTVAETTNYKLFPNVLIYGLAGFGKTSIVKSFCARHGCNLVPINVQSMSKEEIGGISYPLKDAKTGITYQIPINSRKWQALDKENTILFVDEVNRASPALIDLLLGLINDHVLPMTTEDPVTGEVTVEKYFPNILFAVSACNPASKAFPNLEELDPAYVSRHGQILSQEPDIKEFTRHVDDFYNAILNNPNLTSDFKQKYVNQYNIAKTLLTPRNGFKFDGVEEMDQIILQRHKGEILNALNYRSFLMILCLFSKEGTKKDYFAALDKSGFLPSTIQLLKNLLSKYEDAPKQGNTIFAKNTPQPSPSVAKAAETSAMNDIGSFINAFDDTVKNP